MINDICLIESEGLKLYLILNSLINIISYYTLLLSDSNKISYQLNYHEEYVFV